MHMYSYTAIVLFEQSKCVDCLLLGDIQSLTLYHLVCDVDNVQPAADFLVILCNSAPPFLFIGQIYF